jgi:hypothetical protein
MKTPNEFLRTNISSLQKQGYCDILVKNVYFNSFV